jgi:hypothetical protein
LITPFWSDVVVMVNVGALMVMLRFAFAVLVGLSESVTVTVKFVAPVCTPVGVPLMTPVEELRLNPAGRLPVVTAHEYGVMPPDAASVWL